MNRVRGRPVVIVSAIAAGLVWFGYTLNYTPAKMITTLKRPGPCSEWEIMRIRMACLPTIPAGRGPIGERDQQAIMDAILARQSNPAAAWHFLLGELIELRMRRGQMPLPQFEEYARQACPPPEISPVSDLLRAGRDHTHTMGLWVSLPSSRGTTSSFLRENLVLTNMTIEGRTIPDHRIREMMPAPFTTPDSNQPAIAHGGQIQIPISLESGPHPWKFHVNRVVTLESEGKSVVVFEDEWDASSTIVVAGT